VEETTRKLSVRERALIWARKKGQRLWEEKEPYIEKVREIVLFKKGERYREPASSSTTKRDFSRGSCRERHSRKD